MDLLIFACWGLTPAGRPLLWRLTSSNNQAQRSRRTKRSSWNSERDKWKATKYGGYIYIYLVYFLTFRFERQDIGTNSSLQFPRFANFLLAGLLRNLVLR